MARPACTCKTTAHIPELLWAHDLTGKPVSTFPDHALLYLLVDREAIGQRLDALLDRGLDQRRLAVRR
ncbi:hypothetical protein ABTN97_19665, partial [Acinetobacter baumannii]